MKIRNDFVTNSSSSSFVIAYKEDYINNLDSTKSKILNYFVKLIEEHQTSYRSTDYEYRSYDSIEDIVDSYWDDSKADEEIVKIITGRTIDEIKELWVNGFKIFDKEISYHDPLGDLILEMEKLMPDSFKVLLKEEM